MKFILLPFTFLIFTLNTCFAQITYTGGGGIIPDDGTSVDFPLNVNFLNPANIDTINFGVESVCINLTHTYDDDLDIFLIAPDGTSVLLTSHNGGGGDNYTNTCFASTATNSIVSGSAPFSGTYKPMGQLGKVNNGQDGNGTWLLHILDTYAFADQGNVISWNITFSNNPAIPVIFSSSNLPLIKINTNGQTIPNDPKIIADMGIINNGSGIRNNFTDPYNDYNGKIGIEIRGESSLSFPQKSYGIETVDSNGVNQHVSLLGLPPESDWILYGPYTDKSLIRNVLTYQIARDMGWYASRSVFCELFLNDEYQGVYVVFEKIKRDVNRLNISKMTSADTIGDALTGGYILQIDRTNAPGWTSNYLPVQTNPYLNIIYIQYNYPNDNEITLSQQNYIKAYVDSFEDALASPAFANPQLGYRKYANESSFIDYFLINEISKNVDGYRLSTFFNKERNSLGGKISMGPVWDYNLGYRNADYCAAQSTSGWALDITNYCSADIPFWFSKMLTDTNYANQLNCRYKDLRKTILDTTQIFSYIDSLAAYLDEAQQRHYQTWPILGIYVWPNPSPIPTTYQGEIASLKSWIGQRLTWIDNNIPGHCYSTSIEDMSSNETSLQVFPNPSDGNFIVTFKEPVQPAGFKVYDLTGRLISDNLAQANALKNGYNVRLDGCNKGLYMLEISYLQKKYFKKIIIQ